MRAEVICGDAAAVLKTLPDASCDALVTDPPAGIAFMGKEWDRPDRFPLRERGSLRGVPGNTQQTAHAHQRGFANGVHIDSSQRARDTFIVGLASVFTECRRVIKPSGYALVWALPRTSHWTATALEDSGWRIIDIITHHFAQGFPKGKGQLKPASEHWILCRAPGPLQPLQIDACRVATVESTIRSGPQPFSVNGIRSDNGRSAPGQRNITGSTAGRWPPNTLLSHHPDCRPAGVRRVRGAHGGEATYERSNGTSLARAGGPLAARSTVAHSDADGYETVDAWTCVDGRLDLRRWMPHQGPG